ncbi:hypothetical protein PG994_006019 [Apiospora phragmitis]|uniref:Heterokaryon incompatibility domain-containing protein n=1 Tax=Apiospora phragmitis TaxID=2905665 RepID=A0ABR1VDV5_9PEZI
MSYLCLCCRCTGHRAAQCPKRPFLDDADNADAKASTPTQIADEDTMRSLAQSSGNTLCESCTRFDIATWLAEDAEDELVFDNEGTNLEGWENRQVNKKRWLNLGTVRSLLLVTSCPLCRLIFRAFPTQIDAESWDSNRFLRPVKSYNWQAMALPVESSHLASQYAVYVSVESPEENLTNVARNFGDAKDTMLSSAERMFGLSQVAAGERPGLALKERPPVCDLGVVADWLSTCESEHGDKCHVPWSSKLLRCSMIDIETRTIVPCPPQCRYAVLSYVWGPMCPNLNGLATGMLPYTIEDAITVTRALGFKYLWVDALCINQRVYSSPEKMEQLGMMDLIYSCAAVVITGLDGDCADSGLAGVSDRSAREHHGREMIQGLEVFMTFPVLQKELERSPWFSRAWTLQEMLLGCRRLLFTKNQTIWFCGPGYRTESVSQVDPARIYDRFEAPYDLDVARLRQFYTENPEQRGRYADEQYRGLIEMYTRRRMSNDVDSLNACLGMLSFLEEAVMPGGFVWGLPLKDFPQSLRWYHDNGSEPRRRPGFPSWSFTGWEGTAKWTDSLCMLSEPRFGRLVDTRLDLTVNYVKVDDTVVTLDGYLLQLDIRKEPFDHAYNPNGNVLLGQLQDGHAKHKLTLEPGIFDFLLVERLQFRYGPGRPIRHWLYLIQLQRDPGGNGIFTRRITRWSTQGQEFAQTGLLRLYIEPGVESVEEYTGLFNKRQLVQIA